MFKVYCDDVEKSFKFQDLLQKNGYTWHGDGTLNLLQDWGHFNEATMHINPEDKSISANFRRESSFDYRYPDDIFLIKKELDILQPDYKPKKIIKEFNDFKLLESTGEYLYNTVVFKCNNEDETRTVLKNLRDNDFIIRGEFRFRNYPIYLFANQNYGLDSRYISFLNPATANNHIDDVMTDTEERKFHPKIFNYDDSKYVMNIFKTGSAKPEYKPRTISKLNESSQSKYRFKTEQEFIEEFGPMWRNINWWYPNMDNFLGMKLPSYIDNKYFEENKKVHNDEIEFVNLPRDLDFLQYYFPLTAFKEMIPKYSPKKIIR